MDYAATQAALEHFDAVDEPALEGIRRNGGTSLNMSGFVDARRLAADRVRAAYLADTQAFNSPENVDLMSVDKIRKAIAGTFLGKMLGRLP